MPAAKSQLASLIVHVCFVALLLTLGSGALRTVTPPTRPIFERVIPLAPPRLHLRAQDRNKDAGGSNQTPGPVRRGELPVRGHRTFIPPETHPDPKLPIVATIAFDAPVLQTGVQVIGDPYGKFTNGQFGGKGKDGIGDGCCRGVGDGPGGPGFSMNRSAEPIRAAQVIYQPEPEFSDEARKARFQGSVILMIDIGTDGKAHNVRLVQGPGLGLEEKAMEAVLKWRFRPAMQGSKAVVTSARVDVFFHIF